MIFIHCDIIIVKKSYHNNNTNMMGFIFGKSNNTLCTEYAKSFSQHCAYSCVCGHRSNNEDTHILLEQHDDYTLNGIFDGHRGVFCSDFVSKHLGSYIFNENSEITPETIIDSCIKLDKKCVSESGTTATFSIAKNLGNGKHKVFICNVGDSMTILLKKNQNYNLIFATIEHKPNLYSERMRIEKSGRYVSGNRINGQLALSRAFGDAQYKRSDNYAENSVISIPDIEEFECDDGDIIVHICDGITESNFTPQEICDFIKNNIYEYEDLRILSSLICFESLSRGSKDNLSCEIIKLGSCEINERKNDIIPGPCYSGDSLKFKKTYSEITFGMDFEDLLQKRLDLIEKYESGHFYESDFEKILMKHKLIETPEEFEKEKEEIKKIINNMREFY